MFARMSLNVFLLAFGLCVVSYLQKHDLCSVWITVWLGLDNITIWLGLEKHGSLTMLLLV